VELPEPNVPRGRVRRLRYGRGHGRRRPVRGPLLRAPVRRS
jgi:hypothetical protein